MDALGQNTTHQLRIGAVSYLNTKPLVYGLAERLPHASIRFDLPSKLSEELDRGELDIALVPSITLADHPDWKVVSDACIGCRGPVLSVKILFRVPPKQVKTLALDEGSRTSVILAQVLLRKMYGIQPELSSLPITQDPSTSQADATLIIGDRAIDNDDDAYVEVWDLGDRWCRWSELPFVFAMWVARDGFQNEEAIEALTLARNDGCRSLEEIARCESTTMNMSQEVVLSYLQDNLYFYLDQHQRRGLNLFYSEANSLGLISRCPQIQINDCTAETL